MAANPPEAYEIVVRGQLDPHWANWLGGLALETLPNGLTRLHGCLPDQAALHGVLTRVFDLNLELVSLRKVTAEGKG